jgi:hypothetical protein
MNARFSSGVRHTIRRNINGTLEVFWILDYQLQYQYQYSQNSQFYRGSMGNGENIRHLGDPIVGRNADGRLEVFFIGGDNSHQLYYVKQTSSSDPLLDYFHPLGGTWSPNRRPAVAQNADGRLEVFMVGLDNQVYHGWQTSPILLINGLLPIGLYCSPRII